MIFYATKETIQRFKLPVISELEPEIQTWIQKERDVKIFEWGCKLFYLDGRKCLLVMSYETKLPIFVFDIKMKDRPYIGNAVANYLFDLYKDNKEMTKALEMYFEASSFIAFDKITNRSIISSMNRMQESFITTGYVWDFLSDDILHARELNRKASEYLSRRKVDGKEEWFIPYKDFEEKLKPILKIKR